jgi:hypothetical protein
MIAKACPARWLANDIRSKDAEVQLQVLREFVATGMFTIIVMRDFHKISPAPM